MDPAILNPWVVLAVGMLGLATTIWNLVSKPGAKAQADVVELGKKVDTLARDLSGKVDKVEERIAVIEAEMEHLPDRDATHRLELAIAKLEGRFDALDERLKPVAAMASRFQDFLEEEARAGRARS